MTSPSTPSCDPETRAIALHEAGHAVVARRLGMVVHEIDIRTNAFTDAKVEDEGAFEQARLSLESRRAAMAAAKYCAAAEVLWEPILTQMLGGYAVETNALHAGLRGADDLASFFGLLSGLSAGLAPSAAIDWRRDLFVKHLCRAVDLAKLWEQVVADLANQLIRSRGHLEKASLDAFFTEVGL